MEAGQVTWEVYSPSPSMQTQLGKVQLELNLMRDVKSNKKCFFTYRGNNRKTTENAHPWNSPIPWDRAPMTEKVEKAKVLNGFFASAFTIKPNLDESQVPEARWKPGERKTYSGWKKIRLENTYAKLAHIGPWDMTGCTLQVPMELADVIVKSLNSLWMIVIFEDPENLTPVFKNTQGATEKSASHQFLGKR